MACSSRPLLDGFFSRSEVDASDTDFANLLVWQDQNHDGVSDGGELNTLTSLGISSISLDTLASQAYVDGQAIFSEGGFTRR